MARFFSARVRLYLARPTEVSIRSQVNLQRVVSNEPRIRHMDCSKCDKYSSLSQGPLPNSYLSLVLIRDFPAFKASSLTVPIQGAQ